MHTALVPHTQHTHTLYFDERAPALGTNAAAAFLLLCLSLSPGEPAAPRSACQACPPVGDDDDDAARAANTRTSPLLPRGCRRHCIQPFFCLLLATKKNAVNEEVWSCGMTRTLNCAAQQVRLLQLLFLVLLLCGGGCQSPPLRQHTHTHTVAGLNGDLVVLLLAVKFVAPNFWAAQRVWGQKACRPSKWRTTLFFFECVCLCCVRACRGVLCVCMRVRCAKTKKQNAATASSPNVVKPKAGRSSHTAPSVKWGCCAVRAVRKEKRVIQGQPTAKKQRVGWERSKE